MFSFVKGIFDTKPPIQEEKVFPVQLVTDFMEDFKGKNTEYSIKVQSNSSLWVFGAYQELRRPYIILTYSIGKGNKSLKLSFVEYRLEVVEAKSDKLIYPFFEVINSDYNSLIAPHALEQFDTVQIGKNITLIRIDKNTYDTVDLEDHFERIFGLLK